MRSKEVSENNNGQSDYLLELLFGDESDIYEDMGN